MSLICSELPADVERVVRLHLALSYAFGRLDPMRRALATMGATWL